MSDATKDATRGVIPLTDDEFVDAFMQCRISSASFDHRGHLRIAWLLLNRYPRDEAIELICNGIARVAAHFGAPDKFNRTLSEALVRLMAHCGAGNRSQSWDDFLQSSPLLMTDVRGLLAKYYSSDRLFSSEAKQRFLAPDLQPLP